MQFNAYSLTLFQFQYGAIKRKYGRTIQSRQIKFQFQYGAIKSNRREKNFNADTSFNSNMVRLKAKMA